MPRRRRRDTPTGRSWPGSHDEAERAHSRSGSLSLQIDGSAVNTQYGGSTPPTGVQQRPAGLAADRAVLEVLLDVVVGRSDGRCASDDDDPDRRDHDGRNSDRGDDHAPRASDDAGSAHANGGGWKTDMTSCEHRLAAREPALLVAAERMLDDVHEALVAVGARPLGAVRAGRELLRPDRCWRRAGARC